MKMALVVKMRATARSVPCIALIVIMLTGCLSFGATGRQPESGSAPGPSQDAGGTTPAATPEHTPDPSPDTPVEGSGAGDEDLARGATPPPSRVDPNGYSYTVEEYLAWIVRDLDQKWTPWFISRGYVEPQVQYVVVKAGQRFTSRCTNIPELTDTTPNAYYCPVDDNGSGTIWLPVTTFQKMWTGDVFARPSQRVGDFAAAIITAHEFGHHVADELAKQSTAQGRAVTAVTGANQELIADCFAGVWASTAYYDGKLEQGDIEEAIAALEAIGDPVVGGPDPHGTPAERAAAMRLGYNESRDPTPCVNSYWK
jgi:uncharacterized protein